MIEWLIYQRGAARIFWGFCPVCNSDAPALDTCTFCNSHRGWRDKTARRELMGAWQDFTGRTWMRFWV